MAEQLFEAGKASQGVAQEAFRATASRNGLSIMISCDRAVVRDILVAGSVTAITLGAIYAGYSVWSRKMDEAVKRGLGGEREDQRVDRIEPRCLHVLLQCFTDERFLEVLEDYESGIMKDRLLKEFTNIDIEVEALVVKIENWEEVQERKFAICQSKEMAIDQIPEAPKPGFVKTTMDPVKCKANYSRVCQLIVDKGGDALRAALHVVHAPSTLAAVLNANKKTLSRVRYSVINPTQWKLLYPASGTPDSKNFDVTLLTILLRSICGLPSPPAGWNVMPPASDTSISANIARVKIFRNEVYGHTPSAQLDDTTFETFWQEISKPLLQLGIPQQDIDELKETPLSPEEESYIEKLKEWKELEGDLLSKFNDVENQVLEVRRIVESPVPSPVEQLAKFDFTGKIDGLCKKFQDDTRQWFFQKLSSWFGDEDSRVMILTAGPGVGKSVLSAKVCDAYKQKGRLAAYHFCDFRSSDFRNPNKIIQSLASQMCNNVKGFRDTLTEALRREHSRDSMSDAFRCLLNDPLHALNRREPMLIVIDALDESETDDKSEFTELISDGFAGLPEWIKILISSRPDLQVRKKLEHLNPLEILPDNPNHNLDLKYFILQCLPDLNKGNVSSLVSKCEGSFLYAYYLVNELKEMDLGIEPNLNDYVPKGIFWFYERQFKRLQTGLQRFRPDTWSSILECFLNVVAASRQPLPIKILLTCIGLSGEKFEIRETIIGIMSEILPLYEDCLKVYHKSLWDWLSLDGCDEHEFVANVPDGTKRLWHACKNVYGDIASLRSVLDFQSSPEITYALENGGTFLRIGKAKSFMSLSF